MKKILRKSKVINLAFSIAFVLIFAGVAYPCKCIKQSLSKYYKSANAIVLAQVLEVNEKDNNIVEVKLQIVKTWKTDVPQTFSILIGKTSCDDEYKVGEEHLLYLKTLDPDAWTTNKCMGNLSKSNSGRVQKWLKLYGKKANIT